MPLVQMISQRCCKTHIPVSSKLRFCKKYLKKKNNKNQIIQSISTSVSRMHLQDSTRAVGSAHQEPHVFSFHRAAHFRRLQIALSALLRTVIKNKRQAPEEPILESLFVGLFFLNKSSL